jgi:hypothetical protein
MSVQQPSRANVREKIVQLMSGELDRESVSEWAFTIINDDHIRVDDRVVWKILQCLGGVDLPTTDRDYLYEKEDFNCWLNEIDSHA